MQWQVLWLPGLFTRGEARLARVTARSLKSGRTSSGNTVGKSLQSLREYASEAPEYRHSYSGPPPPAPTASSGSSNASTSIESSSTSSLTGRLSPAARDVTPCLSGRPSSLGTGTTSSLSTNPQAVDYAADLPNNFGSNQYATQSMKIGADPELSADLEAILSDFKAPIRYAFAYGSGVFKQAGYAKSEKPMLDFAFAVSHPSHWHSININQNKAHYSLISRLFGSNIISILQTKVGAGVWFNVECLVRGRIIKYGVVSVDTLVHDLMDWETLYLAGRMHKPLHILRDEPRIRLANQVNLSSAVRASLLMLPETFSEEDLYAEITSLSYRGDFRMQYGENPNKVKNIVSSQAEQFQKLYQPILRSYHKHISFMGPEGSGSIRQDVNPKARADLAKRLPLRLRELLQGQYEAEHNLVKALGKKGEGENEDEKRASLSEETALWTKLVTQGNFKQNLDRSIQSIVARSAFSQSAKGVFSVGPIRGVRYVWPKLKKKWLPSK